jgi:DNA repair protein RecO (recombination protein O)
MERSIATQAIVIRRERQGEFHKYLSLLTSDLGLLHATAYGAYRMHSPLRMGSEPFTWSRALLYHNPVKHSYKITELEIRGSFPGLLANLSRFASASLWAEVAQKSYGAGETSSLLFRLFLESLQLLEASDERRQAYLNIQFLWRFLGLAGYQPSTGSCDRCGAGLGGARQAACAAGTHSITCAACAGATGLTIPAGALRYLEASQELALAAAVEIQLEPEGLRALSAALPRMVQAVLEHELRSLRWVGAGT